jgi:hypothetical protein
VRTMPDRKNRDDHLKKITDRLGDSVLELSDETILAETAKAGVDPQREAERTRMVLRQASKGLDDLINRLSELGHNIELRLIRELHNRDWGNSRGSFIRTVS